jgi:import inner membrane translocase subunit TIM50
MLRTAATRLVARAPARQLSTSPVSYVRIRSSNSPGGTSNPNPTNANGTTKPPPPSPAEAPPAPPPETTRPSTFIPEVRQSTPTATQTQTSETSTPPPPRSESNTPLTPPAAEADTLTEEVIEPKDGKYTLPSLDIDPEVALPEPVKENEGGEGGGGKKRTGAGRKDYVSSIERQRKMWARTGMGAAALGALVAAYYASQEEEGVAGAAGSDMSSWERLKTRTSDALDVGAHRTERDFADEIVLQQACIQDTSP